MKKLLSVLLSVALLVCMMPSMAFADADTGFVDADKGEKVKLQLISGETTATVTAKNNYSVTVNVKGSDEKKGGALVDPQSVVVKLGMENISGLGIKEERYEEKSFTTALTGQPDLERYLKNVMEFKGVTVKGSVNTKGFVYNVTPVTKTVIGGINTYNLNATPESETDVRTAWQALTGENGIVKANSENIDDSSIIIKEDTYLRIGNQKLVFDEIEGKDCVIDGISTEEGMKAAVGTIKSHARLIEASAEEANPNAKMEIYLPKDSKLQVSNSSATLDRGLYITSNVDISKIEIEEETQGTPEQINPLEFLKAVANSTEDSKLVAASLIGLLNQIVAKVDGTETVTVNMLGEYSVTYDGITKKFPYGTTKADIVKAFDNSEIDFTALGAKLTGDVTLTKKAPTPSIPSTPSTPVEKDPVTNTGTAGTDNATTNADITDKVITSDGKTEAVVDQVIADKIVDKAVENKSTEVVVEATTAAGKSDASQVALPESTVKAIAEQTDAALTIKTDNAEVTLDKEAVSAVADQAGTTGTVKLVVETVENTAEKVVVELKLETSNGYVSDFNGGNVTVTVPVAKDMADKKVVCVYIDDNGIYHKVDGSLNEAGTHYTFTTGHFSTYAIMSEVEADAVIKDQTAAAEKAAIKKVKATVALSTKNVKKGIKVTVKVPVDQKADKTGIIIYRSMKKGSGYAMYKKVETKNSTYIITNTKNVKGNRLTAGKRYYYKARAYKVIDGKTYYGPMSTVKYMKAK